MLARVNNRPMHRTFNSFFDEFLNEFPAKFENRLNVPPVNIHETDNNYELELSVPGRKKEDFKISLENGLLTIGFERKEENAPEGRNKTIRREFAYESFKRSFTLDDKIDINNIKASYENGILQLVLPKKEEAKPVKKEISIQ